MIEKAKILKPREMPRLSDESAMDTYGLNKEDLRGLFDQICGPKTAASVTMFAMGIISDAQHIMPQNSERARQMMNCSKWLLSHVHSELHSQEMAYYEQGENK